MNTFLYWILIILSGVVILGCVVYCFGRIVAIVISHLPEEDDQKKEKADRDTANTSIGR